MFSFRTTNHHPGTGDAINVWLRLCRAVNRAAQIDAEGDYMAHLYAMFLLAQFRETRAYPLVVRSRRFRAICCILSAATSSRRASARY
jgi:hypothetical protein